MNTLKKSTRVAALDVFRAITMFLMLFVNEMAGVKGLPHCLYHAELNEDMMGFSDLIFPAFLFAMGMAVPFAVNARYKKGDSTLKVIVHILKRSVALIVMGLFTVNKGAYDGEASGLPSAWFSLLMVLGFFLIWDVYPRVEGWKKNIFTVMKIAGVALLVYLYMIAVPKEGQSFGTKWWGILGLLGWSYLLCSLLYVLLKDSLWKNAVALWVMIALCIITFIGVFKGIWVIENIPSQPVLYTLTMAGVVCSLVMKKYAKVSATKFLAVLCGTAVVMLVCGYMSHQWWIISKMQATPTWLFYCLAIFLPVFALVYYVCDVLNAKKIFDVIKPAGTHTLTCYIMPYITGNVMILLEWHYPACTYDGGMGLLRCFIFSLCVVWIAWLLGKVNIKLKL
ncbi:MAG: DUF5009 domain-containing protein [Flavobacteriales bacterium]|nr:DUF5009 domain-containing protein [Flavobacteriales bacterium]